MDLSVRLVVLASGRGSNFAAIASAIQSGKIPKATLAGLVVNNPKAEALEHAKKLGVRPSIVDSSRFKVAGKLDREAYEKELLKTLSSIKPDLVCLAGYMLILGPGLLGAYQGKILNIHPSLLPAFKGLRAQRQAIEAGAKETGATVHFVTQALDDGPIVKQNRLDILPGDTEKTLSERLLPVEHQTYVEALVALTSRPYRIEGRLVVWG